jgi:4-hydroxy-tetrahydrodipicolinate synthase
MITPLRDYDQLDVQGLERLIEHILGGGVHGLFILGTSGEGPSLGYRLRRELITRVCSQVQRRVPVLVGVTDSAAAESVGMAEHAVAAGAEALVLSTPYYFPVGQPELLSYVERLLPRLPLPVFLYNMPQMTKVQFELEILEELIHCPQILGIKDSSGNLAYFDSLLALKKSRPGWSVLVGPEHLILETMRRGGDGGVPGGANFYPQLFVKLFEAASTKDDAAAEAWQLKLLQISPLYSLGQYSSTVVKGMKCACNLLGLCEERPAEPFQPFGAPERQKIRGILQGLGLVH